MTSYKDWIYDVLKNYSTSTKKEPFFVSSWDCDPEMVMYPLNIISDLHHNDFHEFSYKFSEDLFWTKEILKKIFNNDIDDYWKSENFSLGTNATSSIYLSLDTLTDFKRSIYFYHLLDSNSFQINIDELNWIVKSQYIEVIILTDPIYCSGIEIEGIIYQELVEISQKNHVTLLIDGTLSGLEWNKSSCTFFDKRKFDALKRSYDFIYINSEPKSYFMNDLKYALLISSSKNITLIEDLASQVSGGLNKFQINLFRAFHSKTGKMELNKCKSHNLSTLRSNYNLLRTALINTEFALYPTNSGYFTMIFSKEAKLKDYDPKKLTKNLLYNMNILPLLGHYFTFFKENKLSIRVNLMKNFSHILPNLLFALKKYI
jgi:bifunctional pyridoxal-dependent enzyme with beta-cystathionase and maltose regulon repressor activities